MSKLNELSVKKKVVHQLAIGKTQTDIAKQVGVDRSQISRFANKPEVRSATEKLREKLQKKHTTRFIVRKIREERSADLLSRVALGEEVENNTMYQDVDLIEKFLARQDKSGLTIAKGVGILDTNTIVGDDNSQHLTVISPTYQKYLDWQSDNNIDQKAVDVNNTQAVDTEGDTTDGDK